MTPWKKFSACLLLALFSAAGSIHAQAANFNRDAAPDSYSVEIRELRPEGKIAKTVCEENQQCRANVEILFRDEKKFLEAEIMIASGAAYIKFMLGSKYLYAGFQRYAVIPVGGSSPATATVALSRGAASTDDKAATRSYQLPVPTYEEPDAVASLEIIIQPAEEPVKEKGEKEKDEKAKEGADKPVNPPDQKKEP
ncbi:MAG: hypothetical protein WDO70_08095 [Alphaproteobacteria bacterium]